MLSLLLDGSSAGGARAGVEAFVFNGGGIFNITGGNFNGSSHTLSAPCASGVAPGVGIVAPERSLPIALQGTRSVVVSSRAHLKKTAFELAESLSHTAVVTQLGG